jgi:hypothetical protein
VRAEDAFFRPSGGTERVSPFLAKGGTIEARVADVCDIEIVVLPPFLVRHLKLGLQIVQPLGEDGDTLTRVPITIQTVVQTP